MTHPYHASTGILGSEWASPGPAASDFRSDVLTRPPLEAYQALIATSLGDAVFREDEATLRLERQVAAMAGYEDAAFVPTGTMANQLALRMLLHCSPPYSIICDSYSHVYEFEAGGMSLLSGALVKPVSPSNNLYLTLEDILPAACTSFDVHQSPTKVISLENTARGVVVPIQEIQRICIWAHEHGILVHLDGARLWEAVAAQECGLDAYTGYVDALTVDFSKGLGAPMGAAILASSNNVQVSRNLGKAIGGGLRGCGILSSIASWALLSEFSSAGCLKGNKILSSHQMAEDIANLWTRLGGKMTRPCQTNMVWLDLKSAAIDVVNFNALGQKHNVRLNGERIVTHWQISTESVARLEMVFQEVLSRSERVRASPCTISGQ